MINNLFLWQEDNKKMKQSHHNMITYKGDQGKVTNNHIMINRHNLVPLFKILKN